MSPNDFHPLPNTVNDAMQDVYRRLPRSATRETDLLRAAHDLVKSVLETCSGEVRMQDVVAEAIRRIEGPPLIAWRGSRHWSGNKDCDAVWAYLGSATYVETADGPRYSLNETVAVSHLLERVSGLKYGGHVSREELARCLATLRKSCYEGYLGHRVADADGHGRPPDWPLIEWIGMNRLSSHIRERVARKTLLAELESSPAAVDESEVASLLEQLETTIKKEPRSSDLPAIAAVLDALRAAGTNNEDLQRRREELCMRIVEHAPALALEAADAEVRVCAARAILRQRPAEDERLLRRAATVLAQDIDARAARISGHWKPRVGKRRESERSEGDGGDD